MAAGDGVATNESVATGDGLATGAGVAISDGAATGARIALATGVASGNGEAAIVALPACTESADPAAISKAISARPGTSRNALSITFCIWC